MKAMRPLLQAIRLAGSCLVTATILVACAKQVAVQPEPAPAVTKQAAARPSVTAGVPFFYYHDLAAAADWYEHKLGLKKVADQGWVAIFEVSPGFQIGLVDATGGSLTPTAEKGVLLSIETDDLEAWYERLAPVEGINMIHGIEIGGQGLVEEFRMHDPGGYIVEFFRWRLAPEDRLKSPSP